MSINCKVHAALLKALATEDRLKGMAIIDELAAASATVDLLKA